MKEIFVTLVLHLFRRTKILKSEHELALEHMKDMYVLNNGHTGPHSCMRTWITPRIREMTPDDDPEAYAEALTWFNE